MTTTKQLTDTDFMVNTKIKLINDNIFGYKAKISNIESELSQSEKELREKERIFKEIQRKKTESLKAETRKKNSVIICNDRLMENELDKNVKIASSLGSQNNATREQIDSLRREKKAYQNIEQKLIKEIEVLKKNYTSANTQLDDLVNNRLQLENKMTTDIKVMGRDAQLATVGLLTMQQKLLNENKKLKDVHRNDKGHRSSNHILNDTTTLYNQKADDSSRHFKDTIDSKKTQIKTNTFLIKDMERPKRGSVSVKKTHKGLGTHKSDKSIVNEGFLIEEESKIKKRCEEIGSLLTFLHKETNTSTLKELIGYYTELEEENKENYKETKALVDELDHLKDQKLAMLLEIKNIEACREKRADVKQTIIEEEKVKLTQVQDRIEVLDKKLGLYKKQVSELKLSLPVILNKLIFNENEDAFECLGTFNENIHHHLYNLERKSNYILKLVKECNLENFVFELEKDKQIVYKLDENKIKNDITAFEELASKLSRKHDDGEERDGDIYYADSQRASAECA